MFPEKGTVFFPERGFIGTPADAGLAFEDVFFRTADGVRLHAWWVPHPRAAATWLWFHGNAGNISHRLENLVLLQEAVPVSVFLFDYREYGRSGGEISKAGTFLDAKAAYQAAAARDPLPLILFGRSLGTALAVHVAAQHRCAGVVLEAAFTSSADVMRLYFPFVPPPRPDAPTYDSLALIGKVRCPLLFLHGEQDEIIPLEMARRLFAAAPDPKRFEVIPGASHNDTYAVGGRAYFETLARFVREAAARTPGA
ncbi:MAG: alpha/beta hydrolase [candidate division NC10 bacterium]|nr:alpha/beta hydrolase [candidate division NC10 bacterium]MBI4391427.1 alpha/beta hydrolase [candidate division NC10 bacterium]